MNRSELIEALARRFPALTIGAAKEVTAVILEALRDTLDADGRVEIRGFGSFSMHTRPGRVGRNPKTGETVVVPEKRVVHFKPGKELRSRVDSVGQP